MDKVEAGITGQRSAWSDSPKARRVPDACRAIGISRATLYHLAKQGKVRLVRVGGRTLVPELELDRLANQGTA
jgi:excisionase family DNA binding protein